MASLLILRGLVASCIVLAPPVWAIEVQEAPRMSYSGGPSDAVNAPGKYVVSVARQNAWREVGTLSFDKYFRSKELDLSKYVSGAGKVKLRLVQQGGGAAHIDAVLFGERAPTEAKGIKDRLALKKLSKADSTSSTPPTRASS